jgi:predicted nuclease of predicted toxin-antitoxin system
MRLLFDQNLSHRLLSALEDLFPGSLHVRLLGLGEADDLAIWNYAKDHQLVIVTQDSDYSDWNKLRGTPPKIVWLRCGNTSVDQMHSKLRNAVARIQALDSDSDVEIVEVW